MKEKDLYNSFNSIKASDDQKLKMLKHVLNSNSDFKTIKNRKPKLVLATVLVCIMTSTVIAINIPAFQKLLEKIEPDVIEFIEPIEKVYINKGIKMEVVAASRYGNMVKAYITVQDLESNRIGRDFQLLDYYSIESINDSNSARSRYSWSMIDYDKENNMITILVEAEQDTKFEEEDLIFRADNIFYDNKQYEDYGTGIDLSKVEQNPSYTNSNVKEFAAGSYGDLYSDEDLIPILKPKVKNIKFPKIKTSMISNIGIINKKLHVQLWRDENFAGQGVNIYLANSKGDAIEPDTEIFFGVNKYGEPISNPKNTPYIEYIFDVDIDKLSEYELLAYFSTREQIEGPWKISFTAEKGKILEQSCNIDLGDIKIEKISINPFAINLRGNGINGADFSKLNIEIHTENGVIRDTKSNINWSSTSWSGDQSQDFMSSYDIEKPMELGLIKSVTINGVEIIIE